MSYAFPPMTAPEAFLSAKRVGNLPGWDVEVIAAEPFHPGMGNDQDMAAYVDRRVAAVHRISPPVRLPLHRLGSLAHLPDTMRILNPRAVRTAAARHAQHPFDAMLSWSTYHSVHLAARKLKRRYRIPWLAHFSDPWVDNPFVKYGSLTAALNGRLERKVMGEADQLLFTSPETVDLVMAKYPRKWRDKAHVIPHGFDPGMYSGHAPPPMSGRKLIARYLGNFYGIRTPEPLFAALAAALDRQPEALNDLQIEIVGRMEPGMSETPNARRLPAGLVTFRDPVGYRASLELMETADLLLLVDAPAPISVFLPSKLIDYLGARRPILALTSPGAACRVTREAGFWAVAPDNAEAAATALLESLARVRTGLAVRGNVDHYSVNSTGRQLAQILSELVPSGVASDQSMEAT
jgi:hypothetical protein